MKKLLQFSLFAIYTIALSFLVSGNTHTQVGIFPSLFTIPDPPSENEATYLVSKGCPAKSQVKFTWKKSGGNTHNREVTANAYGVAHYYHFDGYSKADYYTLSVECLSDGRKVSTQFSPIDKPKPGYIIQQPTLAEESACQSVANTAFINYVYTSAQSCDMSLTRLLITIGDHWYIGASAAGDQCLADNLIPPDKSDSVTYYSTKQKCEEVLAAGQPKRYRIDDVPVAGPVCQEDPNGPYGSLDECKNAIAQAYVFIIFIADPKQPYCTQIKKESVLPEQPTYATQYECQQALQKQMRWDFSWPPNPSQPCFQTIVGRFESEPVCWAALCDRIELEGSEIVKAGFSDFCKNAGQELITSTPTHAPPTPPHCAELEYKDGGVGEDGTPTPSIIAGCKSIDSAIGNIPTKVGTFINRLIGLLIGIGGGIAVILIVYAGYKLMTSQGNPEAIQGAKNILTSVIAGLLFLIFSVMLLEVITVDILHIPFISY